MHFVAGPIEPQKLAAALQERGAFVTAQPCIFFGMQKLSLLWQATSIGHNVVCATAHPVEAPRGIDSLEAIPLQGSRVRRSQERSLLRA